MTPLVSYAPDKAASAGGPPDIEPEPEPEPEPKNKNKDKNRKRS